MTASGILKRCIYRSISNSWWCYWRIRSRRTRCWEINSHQKRRFWLERFNEVRFHWSAKLSVLIGSLKAAFSLAQEMKNFSDMYFMKNGRDIKIASKYREWVQRSFGIISYLGLTVTCLIWPVMTPVWPIFDRMTFTELCQSHWIRSKTISENKLVCILPLLDITHFG